MRKITVLFNLSVNFMSIRPIFYSWTIVLLVLVSCASSANSVREKAKIVTTIAMIADLARNIAGERCSVTALIGEGVDPHLYKPSRSDIATLAGADIVFYNGLLLEGKMTDALVRVATSGKKVYPVTELLDRKYLLEPKEFAGHYDPHVWMDPSAWLRSAELIRDKLIEFDPEGRDIYLKNSEKYFEKLKELDIRSEKALKTVPASSKVLVTAHDAFNYFGRRFGFEVVGIQGLSTESEAGVRDIERIVNLLVEKKIAAVFVESTVSDRNIRALLEGAAKQQHSVKIGGTLFSDAMGARGTYTGTYIGMIDHNTSTITRALGGSVDEKGLFGSLSPSGQ